MKHLGLNVFSGRSNCCSREMKQSKANPCLEAESLGLNRNKQRNHVVHLAVGKMLKTPFKTRKESQEQQKVNSSQKRR